MQKQCEAKDPRTQKKEQQKQQHRSCLALSLPKRLRIITHQAADLVDCSPGLSVRSLSLSGSLQYTASLS